MPDGEICRDRALKEYLYILKLVDFFSSNDKLIENFLLKKKTYSLCSIKFFNNVFKNGSNYLDKIFTRYFYVNYIQNNLMLVLVYIFFI